jgi:phage terminase large subunit-like protein
VRSGAGRLERLAYERHERDLALAAAPGGHPRGFWFDAEAGDFAVRWIEKYCKHHKGEWAGRPLQLEEWQKFCVRSLFGWKRADGTRRFRKGWIEVPRKNGKTELAAAVGMELLVADGEPGAVVYSTATMRDQARILWSAAKAMVKASPDLASAVKPFRSTLVCDDSKFEPLSADHNTLDGLNPHGDLRDEVHAWAAHELAGVLDTATGARRQPLTLEITTAGTYDPNGVGWQHHEYAAQVVEGAFEDDRLFVFIAAIDDEDDWRDEATWIKANPNLGVSLKREYLREQVEEAERNPSKLNDVLRLHFNRWTRQVERWLSVERWKESEAKARITEDMLLGRQCVGGLDLSTKLDLTAFVLVFPADDGWLDLLCRFWLPENTMIAQAKAGRRHYEQWAKEGWITLTSGDVIDYAFIRREVNELADRYALGELGYDPFNATQIANELTDDGFTMIEVRQGPPSLSEACKLFEAKIVERKVRSTGKPGGPNPVLAWMVGNATKRSDANSNIAPDKKRSKDKIDGVSATVTALTRIVGRASESSGRSMYETEEFTTA